MTAHAATLDLLRSRRPDGPLPGPMYTSVEAYEADLARIWAREWIFAAPSAELRETGDYSAFEIGPWPVVLVRGADGALRGFHNVCRHRGSRICTEETGRAARLVCPYHRWTYDTAGKLLWAKDMVEGFDKTDHGLIPVHVAEGGGMVFVNLSDTPPDPTEMLAALARYAAPHSPADLKVAHRTSLVEDGNWKLTLENNRECYHCGGNHPSLCKTFDENPDLVGADDASSAPEGAAHVNRCEAAGLPSRYLAGGPGAQWRLVRIPLLPGTISYTLDGAAAVEPGLPGMPFPDAGTLLFYHYPNTWNHFLSDHVLFFRVLPKGPGQTEVTTFWLVHKDAEAGVNYDLQRLTEVWIATNAEDAHVVAETHRGVSSPAFRPGPYSMKQESGVLQFVDWYAGAMLRGEPPMAVAAE